MKRLFFGALLLAFTSLAACSSNSNESNSTESRESATGTSTGDVPAEGDTSMGGSMLDTVVVDTNVRGNP